MRIQQRHATLVAKLQYPWRMITCGGSQLIAVIPRLRRHHRRPHCHRHHHQPHPLGHRRLRPEEYPKTAKKKDDFSSSTIYIRSTFRLSLGSPLPNK
jgi:hypothetical protein